MSTNPACNKWPSTSPFFGGPFPIRNWARDPGTVCNGTSLSRAIERKKEVLEYKGNSAKLTKKQLFARVVKGYGSSRKKSWATQTQTYTNPNVNNLTQVGFSLCCGVRTINVSDIATEGESNEFTLNSNNYIIGNCSQLIISDGITLIIPLNKVLTNTGNIIIESGGVITNNAIFGLLSGINNNNGIITINNSGTINNNGYVNNFDGRINNSGTFNNNIAGIIDNIGPLSCWSGNNAVDNGGTFNPPLPGFYPGAGCS